MSKEKQNRVFFGKIFDSRDEEIESLAANLYDRSNRHVQAVQGQGGTGVGDALKDRNFWTLGSSDLSSVLYLKKIAGKIERNEPLKDNEKLLLDAWATNEEVSQIYPSTDAKRGYQVGKQVTEMVPWLIQFAATRGAGTGAVKGIDAALRQGAQKYLGKTIGKVASKGVAEVGGAYAAASLMPQTYGDIVERSLGDTQRDQQGNVSFDKESADKPLKAIYKGWTNNMLEVLTERFGELITGSKLIPKMNMAGAVKGETAQKAMKLFGDFSRSVGWNGAPVEFLEEWINIPLNAMLVGDSKFSDMFDADQQFTTFLTVVAMGSAMGLGQTAMVRGANAVDNTTREREFNSSKKLYETEIDENTRNDINSIIESDLDINAQSKNLQNYLSQMEGEKAGIILNYVVNKMKYEGTTEQSPEQSVNAMRVQAQQEAQQQVNSRLHSTGKHVTVEDREGNILNVKEGDLSDPSGMITVYDQEGNPKPIMASEVSNFEVHEPQEVVDQFMEQIDGQIEQQLQPQPGEMVTFNGQNYAVIEDLGESYALMDEAGKMTQVPKTAVNQTENNVQPTEQPTQPTENVQPIGNVPQQPQQPKYPLTKDGHPDVDKKMDHSPSYLSLTGSSSEKKLLLQICREILLTR